MKSKKSVLFWGAGATARLGMATTAEQNEILFALSQKEKSISYSDCLRQFEKKLGESFDCFCDLLTLLDDDSGETRYGYRMSGFSQVQKDLIEKYKNDIGEDDIAKNRIIMMRMRYDWAAVMRILRVNKRNYIVQDGKKKPFATFVQKVYNFIDANVSAGTGVHIFDEDDNKFSNFLDAQRLIGAKAAMILFVNICFAAAWRKTYRGSSIDSYKKFFRWLSELRCDEFIDSDAKDIEFSTSFVSMNFDPIFWWFAKNADAEYNKKPRYSRSSGNPVYLGEDVDFVDGVRELQRSKSNTVSDGILPVSVAEFVKERGHLENERCLARYQTIKIFFPHGSQNLKICPCCGKTTLYQGDELTWDSETLFPPLCLSQLSGVANPASRVPGSSQNYTEAANWANGEKDYIQCRHCGRGIRMCDTQMLMQSEIKTRPSWVLQRIAHDVDLEIMKAKHIILLGYSLPPDDALWITELQSRTQRINDSVYCSILNYDEQKKEDGWLDGDNLESMLCDSDPCRFSVLKTAAMIFGRDKIRVNFGGFPNAVTSKEFLKDLLYPQEWISSKERNA